MAGVEGLELFTLSAQDTRAGLIRAAFSPDGSQVVTGDIENRATIVWQASRGGDAELANLPAVTFGESLAAHTPDGRYLLVGNAAGGLTAWDAESFTIVRTLGPPAAPTGGPLPNDDFLDAPTATGTWVNALDVSPDGRLVAAAVLETNETPIPGSSLRIWDVETAAEAFRVPHRGIVDDIAWSPDGNMLAISTADVTVDAAGDFASTQQRLAVVDRSGREVAALPDEEEGVQNPLARVDGRRRAPHRGAFVRRRAQERRLEGCATASPNGIPYRRLDDTRRCAAASRPAPRPHPR